MTGSRLGLAFAVTGITASCDEVGSRTFERRAVNLFFILATAMVAASQE
jgi:hypothetical protein